MNLTAPTLAAQSVPGGALLTGPAAQPAGQLWRRWRTPLTIAAVILLGGVVIALLSPSSQQANSYLDPLGTGPTGTHALADILADRGTEVIAVTTAAAATTVADQGARTIVVTSPELLTDSQLKALGQTSADLVIVQPDGAALRELAPGVAIAGSEPVGVIEPGCGLQAAALAGSADMGGMDFAQRPGADGAMCYFAGRRASLVQFSAGSREITILGTGAPLQNQDLDLEGNAALSLNLLGTGGRIAWLTPQFTAGVAIGGQKSIWSLIPLGAYLVALQLGIVLVVTALWRSRRLGPLSIEHLPVVVRASETTEGHARLYQARRARNQAAAALREAALRRLSPALGLPPGASDEATTAALAARSTVSQARLTELLYGVPPGSDGDLVKLAQELDAMEREVRAE